MEMYPESKFGISHHKRAQIRVLHVLTVVFPYYLSAVFLSETKRRIIPVPVRICPIPAIPDIAALAEEDKFIFNTSVIPRIANIITFIGQPKLYN